jgi:iron complex outermembrane recepter protein
MRLRSERSGAIKDRENTLMRLAQGKRVAASAILVVIQCKAVAQSTPPKLEEVIVTSSALRESSLEVAQPTTVLNGDELRRQIATSIGDTLSGELGVNSSYFGPSASQPVIRGLGGYRVQVLQDGTASLDVSSLSQDHAVSVESVVSRQIEVLKGPATLLYGSGAAGGLVNVVTNRIPTVPATSIGGALELRADTSSQERTGALSIDGGAGVLAFHADYFDRGTEDVRIPGFARSRALRNALMEDTASARNRVPNSAGDSSGGALGGSLAGAAGFAGLSYNRYETVYGLPAEQEAFIDLTQDRIDARGEWRVAGEWLDTLQGSASYSDYSHTEFEAVSIPGTMFDQNAYELRVALDHHWGSDWQGIFGAQLIDIDFVARGDEAFVPPSVTRNRSLFAVEERSFERWTLELGTRVEQQTLDPAASAGLRDYDDTAVNLSAGLVYTLAMDRALAVNLTRTERHPQAAELYASGPHLAVARVEIGDPALDKETAYTLDVSLRSTGDGVRWTLNGFYNDYDDFIFLNPTGEFLAGEEEDEPLPVFQYLQGGAKLFGYEAEVVLPLLSENAASLELRLSSDYVRGKLDDGDDLPLLPPLRIGAGLDYKRGSWQSSLEALHNTEQDNVRANELPTASFTMLNLDVSYRLALAASNWLLFARGTNLLDEDARVASSPLKDIVPLSGISFHFGARMEF